MFALLQTFGNIMFLYHLGDSFPLTLTLSLGGERGGMITRGGATAFY